jgi:hypothetical protein
VKVTDPPLQNDNDPLDVTLVSAPRNELVIRVAVVPTQPSAVVTVAEYDPA